MALIERANLIKMLAQDDRYGYLDGVDIMSVPVVNQWIDVNDRLPEDDTPVLVAYIGGIDGKPHADATAVFRSDGDSPRPRDWHWNDSYGIDPLPACVRITHWMPCPEPPGEEER